jgi:hypothetical protein
MENVTGGEARCLFRFVMRDQIRLVGNRRQTPEDTLSVIQAVFKALAEKDTAFPILEDKSINLTDLDAMDIKRLCKLSEKFFKQEAHLTVSGDFLSHIENVKQNSQYTKAYDEVSRRDIDNTRKLNLIKELVLVNDTPEITTGAREDLRNDLLNEIKLNAPILEKMRRTTRIKKTVIKAAGIVAGAGLFLGGLILAVTVFPLGIAIIFFGPLAVFWASFAGLRKLDQKLESALNAQDARMWAYELLSNKQEFEAFCQERNLDSVSVTFDELVEDRYGF